MLVITIGPSSRYLDTAARRAGSCGHGRSRKPRRVSFEVETTVPTAHGAFRIRAYRDRMTGADHLAIVAGKPTNGAARAGALRVPDRGGLRLAEVRLRPAARRRARDDPARGRRRHLHARARGPRHRPHQQARAYRLQEDGLDTFDANLALGVPVDGRDYSAAVAILEDLGLDEVRLMTNNPDKVAQLRSTGHRPCWSRCRSSSASARYNEQYLATKRDRMGHDFIVARHPRTRRSALTTTEQAL